MLNISICLYIYRIGIFCERETHCSFGCSVLQCFSSKTSRGKSWIRVFLTSLLSGIQTTVDPEVGAIFHYLNQLFSGPDLKKKKTTCPQPLSYSEFPWHRCPINNCLMHYPLFACSWCAVTSYWGLSSLSKLGFIYTSLPARDIESPDAQTLKFRVRAFSLYFLSTDVIATAEPV